MRITSGYNHVQVVFSFFSHIEETFKKNPSCWNSRPFLKSHPKAKSLNSYGLGRKRQMKATTLVRKPYNCQNLPEGSLTHQWECEWAGERVREETWWTDVFGWGWGPDWRGGVSGDQNWTTFSLPLFIYNNVHFLFFLLTGGGHSTARMASSNTVLRPRCVRAEHSRYFTAPVGQRGRKTTHPLVKKKNIHIFAP